MTETATTTGPLDRELAFTETYKRLKGEHIAIREALCLRQGRLLHRIQAGDVFAGRHVKAALDPEGLMVGFGLEHEDCGRLYFCDFELLRQTIEMMDVDDDYRARAREMLAFWEREDAQERYYRMLPEEVRRATTSKLAGKGIRLAGVLMDYDKLMRLGIPGLRAEVEAHREDARDPKLYEGMTMALGLLVEICLDYAAEARALAASTGQADLLTMAADLEHVASAPPQTLRQGMQLFWLYTVMSGVTNFGRMDVYLGDLYAGDIDAGRIDETEALRLTLALWRLIAEAQFHFNSRIIVGGMGRRNEANADRFALLAMEASRLSGTTEPQLSLRFHKAQDPALMEKAIGNIAEGGVYPILYNDDVNVPAVQNAFAVPRADAEHYLPYGCGEYGLDHRAFGSPNTGFNLLKCVQAAMHNGVDPDSGEQVGPRTGEFESFGSFEEFWDAYARQVDHAMACVAKAHAVELEVERTTASFLYASMLFDECIERGKSLVDGGARYLGGIVESTCMINAADSLTAIQRLVYDEKRVGPGELLGMLEADWQGYERERRMFLRAPKYGNDLADADEMVCRVSRHACESATRCGRDEGLDYFLLVCINNHVHVRIGAETGATPDGRNAGTPTANGNGPTAGNDTSGVTAFLHSIVKPDATIHAGYVQNMKFSKRMLRESRPQFEALLDAYFASGGTQAMITVVGREDLENAMREPQNYRNLMVRVGGFCAKFVDLDRALQQDIVRRTFYD